MGILAIILFILENDCEQYEWERMKSSWIININNDNKYQTRTTLIIIIIIIIIIYILT